MKLSALFRIPLHAVLKRLGTSNLRRNIWNREFIEGRWLSGQNLDRPYICDIISKYLPTDGTILDLGCSDGIIASTQNGIGKYIGVDISEIAIDSAKKRELNVPCEWECADISKYIPQYKIDCILFRQSLYY